MAGSPRRGRPGWYPRPELIVAVAVVAVLLLVLGAAVRARDSGAGAATTARVRAATGTAAATASPIVPGAAATVPGAATPTPTPSPTPAPTPTPTPAPPSVALAPARVGNGDTLRVVVTAPPGDTGTVTALGQAIPLTRDGAKLWTVVGVPIGAVSGPGVLTVSLRGAAGTAAASLNAAYTVFHVDRPIDNLTLTAQEASILTVAAGQEEARLRAEQFSHFDPVRRWSGRFRWPVTGPITTYFGQGRRINGGPPGDFHSGTDIAADEGTPIHAAAPGRVSWAGHMPIRGNTIVIDHGAGVMTSYSHLSEIDVRVGQLVTPSDVIGKVGHTGLATGPHLHWEVLIYGTDVDAIEWTTTDFAPPGASPPVTATPAAATPSLSSAAPRSPSPSP